MITVVHFHEVQHLWDPDRQKWAEPDLVYIGRRNATYNLPASVWSNPFRIDRDTEVDRAKALVRYRKWIAERPALLNRLHELEGKRVVCWCSPKACHGDVLSLLIDDKFGDAPQTQVRLFDYEATRLVADAHLTPDAPVVKPGPPPYEWEPLRKVDRQVWLYSGYGRFTLSPADSPEAVLRLQVMGRMTPPQRESELGRLRTFLALHSERTLVQHPYYVWEPERVVDDFVWINLHFDWLLVPKASPEAKAAFAWLNGVHPRIRQAEYEELRLMLRWLPKWTAVIARMLWIYMRARQILGHPAQTPRIA